MRSVAAFLLLSLPAWCQFVEFATTDDGQQVYFTTTLVERDASPDLFPESRIFRFDGHTFQLFAERGSLARTDSSGSGDGAVSVHVSGDGQSVALILSNICVPGEPCVSTIQRAEIRGRGARVLGSARQLLLSRNGQWALLVPPPFALPTGPGQPPVQNTESTLVNLMTGEQSRVGLPATADGEFALASDGSLLVSVRTSLNPPRVGIWKDGQLTPLPAVSGGVSFLGLSDDAGTVLASRIPLPASGPAVLPSPDLVAFDLRNRTSKVVYTYGQPGRLILFGLSNNGRRALVGSQNSDGNGPALLVDIEAGRTIPLTLPGETVTGGTLSGFGNAAILATNRGRIVRIPVDGAGNPGQPEELLPTTPYLNVPGPLAPGALLRFVPPVGGSIDWRTRIRLNGVALAILSQQPNLLTVQVPWELGVGLANLTVDVPSDSPLSQTSRLFVAPQSPALPPSSGGSGILAGLLIKADFSGRVTEPPQAGDIVHLYMTGLGAVQGSVVTGQPAPLDDVRPLAAPVHCRFNPYPSDAETLFAGLAPGMVGIYQLTFRMSPDTPPNVAPNGMQCGFNTPGYNFGFQIFPTQ